MSNEHTPTDEEMRDEFINLQGTFANGSWEGGSRNRWNRWITERDARIRAAAEQREAVKALRDAADALKTDVEWVFNTNRGIIIKEDEADPGISPWAWLRDRADQMEGDDEYSTEG